MRLAFFLIVIAGLTGCKKQKTSTGVFGNCNLTQGLDTMAVASKLLGSWNWAKQACGDGAGKVKAADKNIKLIFRDDHSFSVIENGTSLTQGTWRFVQVDGSSWGLDLAPASEYLYGRILFCNNQVVFNDSYRDGCDNLFIKNQ